MQILTIAVSAGVALLTSTITAYITTRLKMREERAKWERDLAFKYAQARLECGGLDEELAKQFAAGLLILEVSKDDRRKVFIPQGGRLIIGRDSIHDIPISDPEISRNHAMITSEGSSVFVQDLGTRQGTYLNGRFLTERSKLKSGDVIQCAKTKITFQKM